MTKEKMVSFNETVYVGLAPNYDRSVKSKWARLTTEQKLDIRLELNYYKLSEMKVHPKSLKHNQYYEFLPETYKKIMIRNNARILQRRSRRTT